METGKKERVTQENQNHVDEGPEGTGVNERSEAGHRSPLDKDGAEKRNGFLVKRSGEK